MLDFEILRPTCELSRITSGLEIALFYQHFVSVSFNGKLKPKQLNLEALFEVCLNLLTQWWEKQCLYIGGVDDRCKESKDGLV